MHMLLGLNLNSISSLLSFTSTYGILLLFIGLIILGIKFYNSLKFEFLGIMFFCSIELFVLFLLDPENVHTSYFFLYSKIIMCAVLFLRMSLLEKRGELVIVFNQFIILIATALISIFSVNSVLNKSLGKINSDSNKNQYVFMKEESLFENKIRQKVRLEIYHKQDDTKVKVIHDSEKESVESIINRIEELGENFWIIENKFLTPNDIK